MNLYLDDNSIDPLLQSLLRNDGHSVLTPENAALNGASDSRHFTFAIQEGLVILTADSLDFEELHLLILAAGGNHPGILLVRFDNDRKRDMKPRHIAAAVTRLESAGIVLINQLILLNQWR
jgi:predicted nuclease of predicted toxin-antitoxin system